MEFLTFNNSPFVTDASGNKHLFCDKLKRSCLNTPHIIVVLIKAASQFVEATNVIYDAGRDPFFSTLQM